MAIWGSGGQLGDECSVTMAILSLHKTKRNINIHILKVQMGFKEIFLEFAE